jgi:UDP-2,3-diacylglucosamine pyrophosphatase LpxH
MLAKKMEQSKSQTYVVISDCHLSAGPIFEGRLNPYEDFRADEQMIEFIGFFCSGSYENQAVELFINGDFLDFLNIPVKGEFEEAVTEAMAVKKAQAILRGHPGVMNALQAFLTKPLKTITYLIGNHDADLFFPQVRELITRAWDPEQRYPSPVVRLIADTDRVRINEHVEIRHGNQFEAVHMLNFENPLLMEQLEEPVLNLPWGSFYVLKIVNQLKHEREFIDKVRPIKIFVIFGLIFDFWFTVRFSFLSLYYFFKTRFIYSPKRQFSWRITADILAQSSDFFQDLESSARKLLDSDGDLQTVIFGHTHKPMRKVYPDGKQYINTGTWTKMINLDLRNFGVVESLTFALIHIENGQTSCDLRKWVGVSGPHQAFRF